MGAQPITASPECTMNFSDHGTVPHRRRSHLCRQERQVVFAKGYGYADLENGIPVDPKQTISRIGSVGKTFPWTAVMQLVERGKLDLDGDQHSEPAVPGRHSALVSSNATVGVARHLIDR